MTPRIYVACLAAYNAGTLHGAWIDAAQETEEIQTEIQKMLRRSPEPGAEEWAIHDYDGFGELKLEEYESIATVSRIAQLIKKHGEVGAAVIAHYGTRDLDEAEEALDESYSGAYKSLADWAYERAEESGTFSSYVSYIDWESVARDLEMSGDVFTIETPDGMVHVFYSR